MDQGAWVYWKTVLLHLAEIILPCLVWYVFLGPKGILVGFGQYFVTRFALFFADVFAPRQRQ
jgi:hypothetical protein